MNIQHALNDYRKRMQTDPLFSRIVLYITPGSWLESITLEITLMDGARHYRYFETLNQACDWLYAPASEQEAIRGAK